MRGYLYYIWLSALVVLLFPWSNRTKAQGVEYLNTGSIKAGFSTGGTLFNAADTATCTDSLSSLLKFEHGYEIPTILSSGLWVTGLDAGGNLKGAGSTIYRNRDWFTGPVSNVYD